MVTEASVAAEAEVSLKFAWMQGTRTFV